MTDRPLGGRLSRRHFVAGAAALVGGSRIAGHIPFQTARPTPSAAQLAWQREELALFVHFGINTFTDREWGDGTEDPALFDPTQLDARQWARAARRAGFGCMILTAKHHDGFCLWPTATSRHSVAASPWRGGGGDLVREFADACRAEGLRVGLYCSPWDRNAPAYGDSPRYNDLYADQLTELLTRYGEIAEVWFDGANGEGPNGRRQEYDWPRVFSLVRRLQPNAVIFSDAGPDVRWCGNERGVAGDPNWSTVDPDAVPYPGASGDQVTAMLQHGDQDGTVWRPAEADVSIRPGWFYHPAEDDRVRTVDDLVGLYFQSVGRNSKLLLNVPPTRAGRLHDTDVSRLAGMREGLDAVFSQRAVAGWWERRARTGVRTATFDLDLSHGAVVRIARLEEDITGGQTVARYALYGSDGGTSFLLSHGSTIGYAKLDLFEPVLVRRARLVIERAVGDIRPLTIRLYRAPPAR